MKKQLHKYNVTLFILAFFLFASADTAEAAACQNNYWQPTFVHDLDNPDGPWYVTSSGQFVKLRIVNNRDWRPHACDLIAKYGIRDDRGYRSCQTYTDAQCGCKRGLSERSSTCANFLATHNSRNPTLAYVNNGNGMAPFPFPETTFDDDGMVPFFVPDPVPFFVPDPVPFPTHPPVRTPEPQYSYKYCPKQNPGKKSSYQFDTNGNPNDKTYLYCSYFKDGVLKTEGSYMNGKKHGVHIGYWTLNGKHPINRKTTYRNGIKHGVMTTYSWCPKGNLKLPYKAGELLYINGKENKSAARRFKSPCY